MHHVLILLAHQDDEYFAAPWIVEELRAGNDVACVYLTDGGSRTDPAVRNAESLRVLQSLGVKPELIAFLGGISGIPDGALPMHLPQAKAALDGWLERSRYPVDRMYSPDYEGGHADHDAVYILAALLANARGITGDAWSFALYNACGCPRPAFRALRLLKKPGYRSMRYSLPRALSFALLCRHYPSQRRTWLGLFPESFLRRVTLRAEWVNPIDLGRVTRRPHDGELLYERMFGVSYEEFAEGAAVLLEPETA